MGRGSGAETGRTGVGTRSGGQEPPRPLPASSCHILTYQVTVAPGEGAGHLPGARPPGWGSEALPRGAIGGWGHQVWEERGEQVQMSHRPGSHPGSGEGPARGRDSATNRGREKGFRKTKPGVGQAPPTARASRHWQPDKGECLVRGWTSRAGGHGQQRYDTHLRG